MPRRLATTLLATLLATGAATAEIAPFGLPTLVFPDPAPSPAPGISTRGCALPPADAGSCG